MRYKCSQFTLLIPDHPEHGKHLLYNFLTRAMVCINDAGRTILDELPMMPVDYRARQWLHALIERGFVVPEQMDEGARYINQRLEAAKINTDRFHVTLSLIQACNFGCTYCYQQGEKTTHDQSRVARAGDGGLVDSEAIITFLKSECKTRNVKTLYFSAYGGEPLLNKRALLEIVSAMQTHCQKVGVRWAFDLVSNGSLLNRKTVIELKRYGFVKVQVTLDGTKETHDLARPFRKADGQRISTYDIIMRNLEDWAGLIRTEVLSVVSESNIESVHSLIDTLADKGLAAKHVRMMFGPISPTYDEDTVEATRRRYATNPELLTREAKVLDGITKLEIHAARLGLIDDLRPAETYCSVIRANGQNITITPDGKIYSCALFLGRDNRYETGNISTSGRGGLDAQMKGFTYPDQCKKCPFLPTCSNCRADALAKTGDLFGANSYREQYERTVPELIKAHYDLQIRRGKGVIHDGETRADVGRH